MRKKNTVWKRWIPLFVFAILLIIIYKTLDNITDIFLAIKNFLRVVSPFLFSILIVYMLYKPCKKLEEVYSKSKNAFLAKKARLFSVFSVYIILMLLITLVIMFVLPVLVNSLIDLANNVPIYYKYILDYVSEIPIDLDIKTSLMDFTNNTLKQLFDPNKIEQITKTIFSFANGILNALVSLIFSLYILLERDKIADYFNNLSDAFLKKNTREQLNKYLAQINKVIFAFIGSKGLDSIINWVVITTILVVFNVKYALLLGLIAGFANFIPYLGALMGVVFISIITLLTGGLNKAIQILILLLIFQQIDGNYIEPKIMGNTLKISPLLIIFAVIVGGDYFGIVGMFLAVPIVTILNQILLEYIKSKKEKN